MLLLLCSRSTKQSIFLFQLNLALSNSCKFTYHCLDCRFLRVDKGYYFYFSFCFLFKCRSMDDIILWIRSYRWWISSCDISFYAFCTFCRARARDIGGLTEYVKNSTIMSYTWMNHADECCWIFCSSCWLTRESRRWE